MKRAFLAVLLCAFGFSSGATAQSLPPDPAPSQPPQTAPAPPTFDRPVSLKQLVPNIVSDQKGIWTFPARLAHGKHLIPVAAFLGVTAALLLADPHEAGYFHNSTTFHSFNNVVTSNTASYGIIAAPTLLFATGLIRKDSKAQHTALLAGEAVADSELVALVLKTTTARARPWSIPAKGNYADSWFETGVPATSGSFPSGHTIAAFSVATVIATRYRNHRWVPFVAYGLAAAVGFSRLSLSAHFASDVFVGAALGYSITRFGVLQPQ